MLKAEIDPTVFVIADPKPGDFANVLALGQLIADRLDARIEVKRLTPRSNVLNPLLRLAVRICTGSRAASSLRGALQRLFFSGQYVGDIRPLAVVSTLGRGEAQGAFVSAFWHAPAIHLGSLKRLPSKLYSAVITHAGDAPQAGEIALSVAPTRVKLRQWPGAREQDGISKLCLLLGGDARGVARYRPEFWLRCVAAAAATARAHQARLTVSTSPRSGPVVEALVEAAVASASLPCVDLFLYGRGDRRDVVPEIAAADAVLVTVDSVSMVSDAIASGARVVGLYDAALPTSSRIRSLIEHHRAAGTLRVNDLATWDEAPIDLGGILPLAVCWSETLWPALEPILVKR